MRRGGVSDQAAAWLCDGLFPDTYANAVEHAIEPRRGPTMTTGDDAARVEFGLSALIQGAFGERRTVGGELLAPAPSAG